MEYLILLLCGFIMGYNSNRSSKKIISTKELDNRINNHLRNSKDYYAEAVDRHYAGKDHTEYLDYADEEIKKAKILMTVYKDIHGL